MNISSTATTISNSSDFLRLLIISLALAWQPAWAGKASFSQFCEALNGHWQGDGAQRGQTPKELSLDAICSKDKRQLLLSVSEGARHPLSETWWFRDQDPSVGLWYFDGVTEERFQSFTLYHQGGGFSLLGEGRSGGRPALIQLLFEADNDGWLWRQNLHYLDEDSDSYQTYRAISLQPR
ncbi:hypothetical protein [Shewanella chilikensis]|uniref:hypothetical protein n=1 Tax=Shewanella chilikensis TaxID=558541 RepID=UPI0030060BEE